MSDFNFQDLRQFVVEHAHKLSAYESSGGTPTLPNFELYARDYLAFAEEELEEYQPEIKGDKREKHLINCISYLKRAMDCELDMFMGAFGLLETFRTRNLKFETKLKFLKEAGVFSSRTLSRLNTIRNKMEHEYEVPKVDEIEVYFDLVSSLIAVLERTITFSQYAYIQFFDPDEEDDKTAWIAVNYNYEKPLINVSWGIGGSKAGEFSCNLGEPNNFAFLFKVFILLLQSERFVSSRYVIRTLEDK